MVLNNFKSKSCKLTSYILIRFQFFFKEETQSVAFRISPDAFTSKFSELRSEITNLQSPWKIFFQSLFAWNQSAKNLQKSTYDAALF